MQKNAGFTLIELLVVVLIIGILAGVALPQYQVAVAKTRIAALIPMLRSIQQAQERYYMEHGSFSIKMKDLDVTCSSFGTGAHEDWCYFDSKGNARAHLDTINARYVVGGDDRVPGVGLYYFYFPGNSYASCYASYGDNEKLATRICKSLSGRSEPSGTVIGADVYRLW